MEQKIRFSTLGPDGSCHSNALKQYLKFQGIEQKASVSYFTEFDNGIFSLESGLTDFVVQCSAHPEVHIFTEYLNAKFPVIDTFIYPTKPLALLRRVGTYYKEKPKLGIVAATEGYMQSELANYDTVSFQSKPLVGKALLDGTIDFGLTHEEYAEAPGNSIEVVRRIGAITTTWIVYGKSQRFEGEILGNKITPYYVDSMGAGS